MTVQHGHGLFQEFRRNLPVNQNAFRRVAHRGPGAFGVVQDIRGHVQVSFTVDVNMTNALSGTNHRHAGFLCHGPDQPRAASGNQHVNIAVQVHQLVGGLPAGILHQGNAVGRQSGGNQGVPHDIGKGLIGGKGFLPAPENADVAGFQAEGGGVYGDIGPGFVDDGHNTQGHPAASDYQPIGTGFHLVHLADGVRKRCHLPHAVHHACNPSRVQCQSVQHGGAHSVGLGVGEVRFVGGENFRAAAFQGLGDGFQSGVFLLGPAGGEVIACGFRGLALLL